MKKSAWTAILFGLLVFFIWSSGREDKLYIRVSSKEEKGQSEKPNFETKVEKLRTPSSVARPSLIKNTLNIDEQLKQLVPVKYRREMSLKPLFERDGVLTAGVFLKNIPLEFGDLKIRKKPSGELYVISGQIPIISGKIPAFPEPRDSEVINSVVNELRRQDLLIKKSGSLSTTWILDEKENLRPCANVEVEFVSGGKHEREKWCLDPLSLKVQRKTSLLRKF